MIRWIVQIFIPLAVISFFCLSVFPQPQRADMSHGSQNRDGKGGSSFGCYLALLERVLLAHLTLMGQMKSGDGHTR